MDNLHYSIHYSFCLAVNGCNHYIDLPALQSLSVGYLGMKADHVPKAENGRELTEEEAEEYLFNNTLIMQCTISHFQKSLLL